MADSRRLSDMSLAELHDALTAAEERVDLSRHADSARTRLKAEADLEAINREIGNRRRRAAT